MTELWKPVVGYEGIYEVSSFGRVRSLPRVDSRGRRVRGGMLTILTHPSGHQQVKLSRDGRTTQAKLHRVVLEAFIGPPAHGYEALHDDGNPANNNAGNLRWGTRSENMLDRVRHGTHHFANKTHCPHGHPYDEDNTYVTSDGRRMCKECLNIRTRERRARLREAA